MIKKIQKGQKFTFLNSTTAIALFSSFSKNAFLGFQAPADIAKKLYRPELLKTEIDISKTDIFITHKAYASVTGWCVVGRRRDGKIDVHFHQKISKNNHDYFSEFLEIVIN